MDEGQKQVVPTVVSFFTPQKIYQDFAEELKTACDGVGLDHFVVEAEDRGSWVENCARKGTFCLEMMHLLERPILWIDADGKPKRMPELLIGTDKDFGIYAFNGGRIRFPPGRGRRELPKTWPDPPRWFNSGTVFFNNTPGALTLLDRWAELCLEHPHDWDQWLLQEAWCESKPSTEWLPKSYCAIGGRGPEPVIVHDMASTLQPGIKR